MTELFNDQQVTPPDEQPSEKPAAPATSWPARLALLGLGLVLILVLELLARWLLPLDRLGLPPETGFELASPPFVLSHDDKGTPVYTVHPARSASFPAQRFAAKRQAGEALVFCIGGSSVYGYPYGADYAFPHRLQRLLTAAHPERGFEVVNVGGMSYGSQRLALLSRQLMQYQPDLLVVYTGHNELVEEDLAGALQQPPAWLRGTRQVAGKLHLYRLVAAAVAPATTAPEQGADSVFGIDVKRREDRQLQAADHTATIQRYRSNLESIVETGREHGVAVVLCTVAGNLADWQPAAATVSEQLETPQLLAFALDQARAMVAAATDPAAAATAIEQALAIDPLYAPLNYRLARIQRSLGQVEQARQRFQVALRQDGAPIRAFPELNQELRALAGASGVALAEVATAMATASPDGITGHELFLDYCHPNAPGHQLIAETLLPVVEQAMALPASPPVHGPAASEPAPENGFAEWWLGNVALRQGRLGIAEQHLRLAVQLKPDDHRPLVSLAQVLQATGRASQALDPVRQAVAIAPASVLARNDLGVVLTRLGQVDEALQVLEQALALDPGSASVHSNLGAAYLRQRQPELAAEHLRQAARTSPGKRGVYRNLGLANLLRNDVAAAADCFLQELRRNPGDALSATYLAECWLQLGHREQATAATRVVQLLAPGQPRTAGLAQALGLPPVAAGGNGG